jgi:hypothetical protein
MTQFYTTLSINFWGGWAISSNANVCDRPSNTSATDSAIAFLVVGDRPVHNLPTNLEMAKLGVRSLYSNSSLHVQHL